MGLRSNLLRQSRKVARCYSDVAATPREEHRCKLLVVGGGAGGCSTAWRFSKKLDRNEIIVIEPSTVHYNQPVFSLVAAGMQQSRKSQRPMKSVLPRNVRWMSDHVEEFDPCSNAVRTRCGNKINYEFMVIAVGLKNDYEKIPGLKQALNYPHSGVSTIYSPAYCVKTWCCIKDFQGGHAIFTFPQTAGKCAGAAQKIMFLADDYWRQNNKRGVTNITFATGGTNLFGIEKYASALKQVARNRDIAVNYCTNLLELTDGGALFASGGKKVILPFNLLHVTPPMSPPACLQRCTELVTEEGYLHVDKYTLRHKSFTNIYGLGDCTCTPNSKTAAAVAQQSYVVEQNLSRSMAGQEPTAKYNGYGACPMLTSYNTGLMAEFLYDKQVCETFPFDQSKERRSLYYIKRYVLPYVYWNKLIKGKWNGPSTIRKIINPFGYKAH